MPRKSQRQNSAEAKADYSSNKEGQTVFRRTDGSHARLRATLEAEDTCVLWVWEKHWQLTASTSDWTEEALCTGEYGTRNICIDENARHTLRAVRLTICAKARSICRSFPIAITKAFQNSFAYGLKTIDHCDWLRTVVMKRLTKWKQRVIVCSNEMRTKRRIRYCRRRCCRTA